MWLGESRERCTYSGALPAAVAVPQRQRRLNQSSGISSAARAQAAAHPDKLFQLTQWSTHLFQLQCLLFYTIRIFDSSSRGWNAATAYFLHSLSFRWPFCVLLRLLGLNVWPSWRELRRASSKPWLHFNLFFPFLAILFYVYVCVGEQAKKKKHGIVLKKNAFQRDIKC